MVNPYAIRVATPADDHAVGELLVHAFVTRYARKMPEVVVSATRQSELRNVAAKRALAQVWVAECRGEVVGTVALWSPGAPGSEAWVDGAGDIRHLAIAPEHSGQGVAKLLLDGAEGYAFARGDVGLCLHVRRGAAGVRALYESRGYVRAPQGDIDRLPEVFLEALYLPGPASAER
jgi:ribosomal protein S18 acetylase RimI-like enzyme